MYLHSIGVRVCMYTYIYIFITVHQYANTCHCRFIKVSCFKQECFSLGVFFFGVCVCAKFKLHFADKHLI